MIIINLFCVYFINMDTNLISGPISMYAFSMPRLNRYFYLFGDHHHNTSNMCSPDNVKADQTYITIYKLVSKYIKANKSGSPIDVFVEAPYECPVYEKLGARKNKNPDEYHVRALDIMNLDTEYPLHEFIKKLMRYGYYAEKPSGTDDSVLRVHFTNIRSFKHRAPYAISKASVRKMYQTQDPVSYVNERYQKQYAKFRHNHKIIKQVRANDPKVAEIILTECERLFYKNMKYDLDMVHNTNKNNQVIKREIKAGRIEAEPESDIALGKFTLEDCIMIAERVHTNSRDILIESYTLLRMFRRFNTTGKKQHCTKVVAYFGNAHIQVFMDIIEKLKKVSQQYTTHKIYSYDPHIKKGGQPNRCIPIPAKIQPFFGGGTKAKSRPQV